MYNAKPYTNRFSFATVAIITIVVIASIAGNIYTYLLFTQSAKDLENKVATFQTQVDALTAALGNYSKVSMGNISLSELYENAKDSVVLVRGERLGEEVAGSGFVIHHNSSDQMVVITNYHVVEGTSPSVTFRSGHAYASQILGWDVYADLAVLSVIDAPPEVFKPLAVVSSTLLDVGDFVIAVGNPYGLVGSMTTGIVSQLGRAVPEDLAGGYSIANVIQISAPLNPGNSGGPLLNAKGQVVGITFAIIENSTGVGFAIPSDTVLREISLLIRGDPYRHSWIGVMGTDMNYELAQEMGALTTYGWLIVDVIADSPAADYGLRVDDIILALNDTRILGGDDISAFLEDHTSPGHTVNILVERSGSETTIPLVLGIRQQPP